VACEPPACPPATPPPASTRERDDAAEIARLQRTRQDLLDQLALQRTRCQAEQAASGAPPDPDRDAIELRALTAIQSSDVPLDGLKKKRLLAAGAEQQALEARIATAEQARATLIDHLKTMHSRMLEPWPVFRQRVEATISRLIEAIEWPRGQRQLTSRND
jgi:hypothetical protein